MSLKKRDWLFIALIVVVFGTFYAISGKIQTARIPYDDDHRRFFEIVRQDGKKAAEKHCDECHSEDGIPFSEDHPPKFRCLFCHKLEER